MMMVDDNDDNINGADGNDEYFMEKMTCLHIANNENNDSRSNDGNDTDDNNDNNVDSYCNDAVNDNDDNSNDSDFTDDDGGSDNDGYSDDDTYKYKLETMTWLHLAIMNRHWNAVRWLVQHGSDCGKECRELLFKICDNDVSPIIMLARYKDAPLDLFGLLKTPTNLNGNNRYRWSDPPLHVAVKKGHISIVNQLIKLGASVNQENGYGRAPLHLAVCDCHTEIALSLIEHGASVNHQVEWYDGYYLPIERYINKYIGHTQNKRFFQLIPEDNMDILKAICTLLKRETEHSDIPKEHRREVASMLHKLIQKLKCFESLSMTMRIREEYGLEAECNRYMYFLELNQHLIAKHCVTLKALYLCSVLLILLGCTCDVSFRDFDSERSDFAHNAEHVYHASAIKDLWDAYNKNKCVKRLQALCIQKTRQSIHNLADESFDCLPVPSSICKLLMRHDVADVLFKAYQM